MAIKVSTLLSHNTILANDPNPTLGAPLNTNNNPILNGGNPVTITGNEYPINFGSPGQVLTTNGFGILSWQTGSGTAGVTSVGLTSAGNTINITGISNPITSTGTFNVDLPVSGVVASTYGSSSNVGVFTVNSNGIITSASNTAISITPAAAGLGNVTNSLQVINLGGAPSLQEGSGIPVSPGNIGAVYIDQAVTNGNGIYYYNGSSWNVVAQKLNLYNENSSVFTAPLAQGTNSIALGEGATTLSSAKDSLAIGLYSVAKTQGEVVQASGRFATNGDAQAGRYLVRNTTIDATPTELFVDGSGRSVRVVLQDNSTWTYKVTVTGHRTDLNDGHAGYTVAGVIYRNSGAATTSLQGSPIYSILAESNPAWDINISADFVNGSIKVTVTGEAGKQIRWVGLIETVEVTN